MSVSSAPASAVFANASPDDAGGSARGPAATIALIGLPGSGKSTVGRQLARRLQQPFVDADSVVEQRLGCSIRTFFEREGEARFRDMESAVLAELLREGCGVLSTGGGAVLRPQNRALLRQTSRVFYLHSTPEALMRRLRHDTQRPLLQVADPLARMRELHATRDPLYRETAHFILETGRPSVAALVNTICMQLELATGERPKAAPSSTPP